MARNRQQKSKRGGKARANRFVWSNDERLELLAWFDWCLEHDENFDASASKHLRTVTGKDLTYKQIHGKLKREFNRWGICANFKDFCSQGTVGLTELEEADQIKYRDIRSRLESQRLRFRVRSVASTIQTRSRTLSSALSTRSASNSNNPPRHDIFFKSRSPSHRNVGGNEQDATIQSQPLPAQLPTGDIVVSASEPRSSNILKENNRKSTNSTISEAGTIPITSHEANGALCSSPILEHDLQREQGVVIKPAKTVEQANRGFVLKNRLLEAQRTLSEFQHRSRVAEKDQNNPNIAEHLREQIYWLKGQLGRRESLDEDIKAIQSCNLGSPKSKIGEDYRKLHDSIKDTFSSICKTGFPSTPPTQECNQNGSLEIWAHKIPGWSLSDLLSYCRENGISEYQLLSSLIAAGLCELVFEPIFPDILASESPLLDLYRELIQTKYGRKALRELDAITLKSLLSTNNFREFVLPEKAESLAEFFFRALRPFLIENEDDGHSAHRSPSETPETQHDYNTFLEALEVKVAASISASRFKIVFFKPGDKFNRETMEREDRRSRGPVGRQCRSNSRGQKADPDDGKPIKLCLLPALYFAAAKQEEAEEMEDAIPTYFTDYSSFLTEDGPTDMASLVLVAKAIVLVQEEIG